MLRAGIDIGTNTILLLVAEVDEETKSIKVLEDHTCVVRLGEGVDKTHVFNDQALERAKSCFKEYKGILDRYPGVELQAVATSGSRDARNATDFFKEIERSLGLAIRIISGEEEAKYSFIGALSDKKADEENYAVLDIGGGSTEIIAKGESSIWKKSFDIGCVRLTERFFSNDPPSELERSNLSNYIRELLYKEQEFFNKLQEKRWLGVAGTATYVSSSHLGLSSFDREKVHGSTFDLVQLNKLIRYFSKLTLEERLGIGGMDRGRADVIISGAIILQLCLEAAKQTSIEVSIRGLRYGLVLESG